LIATTQRRGAELFANALAASLRACGHTVAVWAVNGTESGALAVDGVLSAGGPVRAPLFSTAERLARVVREFDPDILQASGGSTTKVAALAAWLGSARRWRLVHRNIGDPRFWFNRPSRRLFYRLAVWPKTDGVVFGSAHARSGLDRIFGSGLPPGRVIVQGIDEDGLRPAQERATVRQRLTVSDRDVAVVWVGALTREKRADRALRVVQRCWQHGAPVTLWIVGDGPLRSESDSCAEQLGMTSRVRWIGSVEDVGTYLGAADAFLLTSDTEGIPGALLEAMTVGLPCVATDVGGISEVLEDGRTGFLAPPDDEDALADRLSRIVRDQERRRGMGEAARRCARERFDMNRCVEAYADFFRSLTSSSESHRSAGTNSAGQLGTCGE
jgi:glycosyltransferase involved in cell wall biosynthesis